MFYEYKLVPAPAGAARADRGKGDAEDLPHALSTVINLRALGGWDYAGSETVVEERRTFIFFKRTAPCTYLVFRRMASPLRTAAQEHDRAVAAATAAAAQREEAQRQQAREDLVASVRAGQRRVRVRPPEPLLLTGPDARYSRDQLIAAQ